MRGIVGVLGGLVLATAPLRAQGVVRGVVFDSLLTRAPLAGATVVVQGTALSATTDGRGRFEFRDLAPGPAVLGFFHPALDSLDIAAPARAVEVAAVGVTEVALATPSPNTASLRLCRVAADPSTAVLVGAVRAAEDDAPLAGAEASVRWFEVVIDRTGARQLERVARDSTDADGRYRLCGVPNDIALTLVATHAGQATGPLHLALDSAGVARRDLRVSRTDPAARTLPDASPADTVPVGRVAGLARLGVEVRNAAGNPVRNAIVGVRGWAASAVTDETGQAILNGVPSGSQTVVVRAIGLQPQHRVVAFTPGRLTEVTVALERFVTLLPAVAVVGQRPDALTEDIRRRMRAGQGYLLEGDALRDVALMPSAWARIPGVSVGPGADPLPLMRGQGANRCVPEIWVDGMRMMRGTGWELRGLLLNATRVEVYTAASRVPVEFTTISMDPCGVVLIWSR